VLPWRYDVEIGTVKGNKTVSISPVILLFHYIADFIKNIDFARNRNPHGQERALKEEEEDFARTRNPHGQEWALKEEEEDFARRAS